MTKVSRKINRIIYEEKIRFAKFLARGMDRDEAEELFIKRLKSRLMPPVHER